MYYFYVVTCAFYVVIRTFYVVNEQICVVGLFIRSYDDLDRENRSISLIFRYLLHRIWKSFRKKIKIRF